MILSLCQVHQDLQVLSLVFFTWTWTASLSRWGSEIGQTSEVRFFWTANHTVVVT